MLLNTIEHLAYRVGGLAVVLYASEKTNLLESFLGQSSSDVNLALKTSAVLSGSEFLSDQLLSMVTNIRIPTLYTTIQELGIAFVVNAVVLLAMDKLKLDEKIVSPMASDEMKAIQLGVMFVIVQEISNKVIHMYLGRKY